MRFLYLIIFLFSIIFSQDQIDKLIQDVLHGTLDSAAISLPMIEQNYPNNPSAMFLKGLLEIDGKEAMIIFSKLYNNHPTSSYADASVMKVAEYYYAAGLYVQASEWLKKMPIYYSRSEHIERALKLFLNSLIVSGHKDTAIFYSKVFEHQFPHLNVNGRVNRLIKVFEESDLNSNKFNSNLSDVEPSEIQKLNKTDDFESVISDPNHLEGAFSLQTGAFSVRSNAETQKNKLKFAGFNARVSELYRKEKVFYAVQIGHFPNKEEASHLMLEIKSKLDLETIVVKTN